MTAFLFGILVGVFLGASVVSFVAIRKIEALEDREREYDPYMGS